MIAKGKHPWRTICSDTLQELSANKYNKEKYDDIDNEAGKNQVKSGAYLTSFILKIYKRI